ncbi:MAG: hypothetical protein E7557_00070 [Ruminococcaceae bacterium]|nr:hypothetical protein [Oscillospiraceae bacterium]
MTRKYNIDILRIISALAIIGIHIIRCPIHNSTAIAPDLEANLSMAHRLLLWAVPVFFMITGYCLMQKQDCTYKYAFEHVRKYIAVLFTVGLFFALLELFFAQRTINLSIIKTAFLNVIVGNLWDHMWFVYAIIGIYLVVPLFHNFFQKSKANAEITTLLLLIFTVLLPQFKSKLAVANDYPFVGYLFYVCFGMLIAKTKPGKIFIPIAIIGAIVSAFYLATNPFNEEFNYLSLGVAISATSIFTLATYIKAEKNKTLLNLSSSTWGVYLIHTFFINIAVKVLNLDLLSSLTYLKLGGLFVAVTVISFAVTFVLRKIPLIKYLF